MNNPLVYTLAALEITPDMPLSLLTPITDLEGMTSVTFEADFRRGSGGTSCFATAATTFDGGVTWLHIARFDFLTTSRQAWCTVNAGASKAIATYADLSAEGVNDALLGDQLAVFLQSVGSYSGTSLALRASVR